MALLAFDNFDSDTPGAIAPGWLAVGGTWQVGTTTPVSGAQSFSCTTHVNGQIAVYTAGSSGQADQATTISQKWATSSMAPMARTNSTAGTGYIALASGTSLKIFRVTAPNTFAQIAAGSYGAPAAGDTVVIELSCVGTTIQGRLWNVTTGGTRPATATVSVTDSTTAAGIPGVYMSGSTLTSFDDFTWTNGVPPASAIVMTGPSAGIAGASSDAFAIGANGSLNGAVTVTLSDGGAGGSFYPGNAVTITPAAPVANVSYLRPASGASTISQTNNASLANAPNVAYTATASQALIPVDNAAITWSPFNWDVLAVGDFGVPIKSRQTTCCGAYAKFRITGTTSIALAVDASQFLAPFTQGTTPCIEWRVWAPGSGANGARQKAQLVIGSSKFPLAAGLTAGTTYEVEVYLLGTTQTTGDRWGSSGNAPGNSPTNVLRTPGFISDSGATLSAYSLVRPNLDAFYGDSITEGVRAAGTTVEPLDHGHSTPWFSGPALNAEYAVIGYGGTSWNVPGNGNVPTFSSTWNFHSAGRPRSLAGVRYLSIMHGAFGADAATVQSVLTAMRAACPAAWIFVIMNPGGINTAGNTAGVNNYLAANPTDMKTVIIDPTDRVEPSFVNNTNSGQPTPGSVDGLHPNEFHHGKYASAAVDKVQALFSVDSPTAWQSVVPSTNDTVHVAMDRALGQNVMLSPPVDNTQVVDVPLNMADGQEMQINLIGGGGSGRWAAWLASAPTVDGYTWIQGTAPTAPTSSASYVAIFAKRRGHQIECTIGAVAAV
jgi:hypothetical protein